jgi:hypothetical protein
MKEDDLLFGLDDLERWKRGEQPMGWLGHQKDILLARLHSQSKALKKVLASADPATVSQLKAALAT